MHLIEYAAEGEGQCSCVGWMTRSGGADGVTFLSGGHGGLDARLGAARSEHQ
jgi:hypothetical protein